MSNQMERLTLTEIRTECKMIKSQLREHESAFERQNGRRPRKKKDWAPVFDKYERYAELREEDKKRILATVGEAKAAAVAEAVAMTKSTVALELFILFPATRKEVMNCYVENAMATEVARVTR